MEVVPGYLTILELAERLRVTERTIRTWVKSRKIPFIKIGKTIRFVWADVDERLRRNGGQ